MICILDKDVPIHLIDDKMALFRYPSDITEDDIEIIKHQIDGILLRIKLESKKKSRLHSERGLTLTLEKEIRLLCLMQRVQQHIS